MHQVLFRIPIPGLEDGLPIYGYGMMLFLVFLCCNWLASRLAEREGIAREHIQDLALWLFVGGLLGSRIVFMIQFRRPLSEFFFIWEGGLVFYGGLLGGTVAFFLVARHLLVKHGIPILTMADIIAPCLAVGLALGRVGCLLNGCCYGGVACPDCPAIHFPLSGMPRGDLVSQGYQTAAGFTLKQVPDKAVVALVEPNSAADIAGLRPGDVLIEADGKEVGTQGALAGVLFRDWPRGKNDLLLKVERDGEPVTVGPFEPRTIGLHPTQVYETITATLLLGFLLSYRPYRRHAGELMALFLILYPIHRFLNEMLRIDTAPVALGMTLSQNGSLMIFIVGIIFFLWLRRLPTQGERQALAT